MHCEQVESDGVEFGSGVPRAHANYWRTMDIKEDGLQVRLEGGETRGTWTKVEGVAAVHGRTGRGESGCR